MVTYVLFSGNGLMRAMDVVRDEKDYSSDNVVVIDCGDECIDTHYYTEEGFEVIPLGKWKIDQWDDIVVITPNYPVPSELLCFAGAKALRNNPDSLFFAKIEDEKVKKIPWVV